jgi:hypothetical protein
MLVLSSRSFSLANVLLSPVYEYPLNGQWIMMDIDDGYILWTGIWKGKGIIGLPLVYAISYFISQLLGIRKVHPSPLFWNVS